LVAAPIAAVGVPAAALAGDDSRARLARLEDERAIEALHRAFLRHGNGSGDCAALVSSSDALDLVEGLRTIAEDPVHEASIELAEAGRTASHRCACRVERESEFTGDSTIKRMARYEGHGHHRHEERRVLAMDCVKQGEVWLIARARLA